MTRNGSLLSLHFLLSACACSSSGADDRPGTASPPASESTVPQTTSPVPAAAPTTDATAPPTAASSPGAEALPGTGGAQPMPTATDPVPATAGSPPTAVVPEPTGVTPVAAPGEITFSVPSGTFEGQVSVAMTTSAEGAEIRYTTDRTLPTAGSALFDGTPLVFTQTTELRAQAFAGGVVAGAPKSAMYVARSFDTTSDIPLVILEGYAQGKPTKEDLFDAALMTFEPMGGEAALSVTPTLATRIAYHLRGQSSSRFEKAPYRVELLDEFDEDLDLPLLGMPDEADWALIGPWTDRSLIRNALLYSLGRDMGLVTMRLEFAEVYINQDAGPLEPDDYQGVYAVTEIIKNQKNRIDLQQLAATDVAPEEISGGYIIKFEQDAVDEDETSIECTGSERWGARSSGTCFWDLAVVDPDPIAPEQLAWLTDYIQGFHDSLHQSPLGDYAGYVDVPSLVDHFIINEISRDIDAFTRSTYYHKDRDGLLVAGPLWDYNLALNAIGDPPEGWQWEEGRPGNNDWFRILGPDPAFLALVSARWQELRGTILSEDAIDLRIEELTLPIANAARRDMERWPVGGNERFSPRGPETWDGQIEALREWIAERMAWLDGVLL